VKSNGVAVGDVIAGKYLVEAYIGEGGVGLVVAARNQELGERVALKFLRPEMLARTDIVARFMREAKAACSIKSEYVAAVYDVGIMGDGAPFLVMEHLEGQDLGRVIEERGHLGYREATEYLMQACEALAVAHAKGVVHRDIKPENLFLTTRAGMNVVKILDFGISKAALTGELFGNELPRVETVNLMGTPLYMSPEQVRNADDVDSRSDIWSLGIVLYEMLTGRQPLHAQTITELCAKILESPLTPVSTYRTDLPHGYAELLEKCLEKDVSRRFQNVAEVAHAFMAFAPKRARICAERAAQALLAAGLIDDWSGRFDSNRPPSSESSLSSVPSAPIPDAPLPRALSGSYVRATKDADPSPGAVRASAPAPNLVTRTRSSPPATDVSGGLARPARSRTFGAVAAGALLVGLGGAGATFLARRSTEHAPPAADPPAAATVVAPTAARPVEEVVVDVSATPASARIFVDGKPMSANPSRLRIPRAATTHEVRAEADGHEPRTVVITFDRDRSVDLALAPKKRIAGMPYVGTPATQRKDAGVASAAAAPVVGPSAEPSSPKGITEIDPGKRGPGKHDSIDTDIFRK